MKNASIGSAWNSVKNVAIAMALLGCWATSLAPQAAAQNGWAVGNNGTIIGTTNGGGQWIPERTGGAKLNAVSALPDGSVAWAVGDTAGGATTFLQGTRQGNGTVTWAAAGGTIPVVANLNGVFFVDASHGWAVGDVTGTGNNRVSTILFFDSTNNSWVQQIPRESNDPRSPRVQQKLNSVYFITRTTRKGTEYYGWAVGNAGTVLFFNNQIWTQVNLPAAAARLNFTSVSVWSVNNRENEGTAKNALAQDHVVIYAATSSPGQVWFSDSYFYKGTVWKPMQAIDPGDKKRKVIEVGMTINAVSAASSGSCWIGQAATGAQTDVQYIYSKGQRDWQWPIDKSDTLSGGFGAVSGLAVTQDAAHSDRARHVWIVGPNGQIDYRNGTAKDPTWANQYTPGSGQEQPLNAIVMVGTGGPATTNVKLEESTAPNSGAADATYVSLTGSGFPEGDINPANVVIDIATQCMGVAMASTPALSSVGSSPNSKLLSFLLPDGLAPGKYYVSISDSSPGDANFQSGNCSTVNVMQ